MTFNPMYEVTAYITQDHPANHAPRSFEAGELLFKYLGYTYGCINEHEGVAVSEVSCWTGPFYQVPKDRVREVE